MYIHNLKLCQPLPIQSHLILFHLFPSNSIDYLIAMADNTMQNGVFTHNNVWPHHEPFSSFLFLRYNLNRLLHPKTAAFYLSFPWGAKPLPTLASAPELAWLLPKALQKLEQTLLSSITATKRHLTVLWILRKHTASSVDAPALIPWSKYVWPDWKTRSMSLTRH